MTSDVDVRIAAAMKEIFNDIPLRVNINGIVKDAYERLMAAVSGDSSPAPQTQIVAEKIAEVLREIASYAVEQFTRRTGQEFLWVDEPEPEQDEDNTLMHFTLDEKGNVVF